MKEKRYIKDNEELMKEWHWRKNNKLDPSNITYGSTQKIWWICSKGHEWQVSPNSRINDNKITSCPYCLNRLFKSGYNDLQTMNPKLAKEWNFAKNLIKASEVIYGGHTKYWWRCSKGHEWKTSIIERRNGTNCPYCSNKAFKEGYNDLNLINPELVKEWNVEKNKQNPFEVKGGGGTKYWWKCSKGHSWKASIILRKSGSNCPFCSRYQYIQKNLLEHCIENY